MAIEKLTTRLKNKTSTKPQIKHNKNHNLRRIRPQTQHNNPEHIFKILNTTTTICGENCFFFFMDSKQVYTPININIVFSQRTSQQHGSASHHKWLRRALSSAIHPMQWMGLMMICCGMALKSMGMLGVSVSKMKALTVKVETVTLTGKGAQNVTCFVYWVCEIKSKIFLLAGLFLRGHLWLESSCSRVNTVLAIHEQKQPCCSFRQYSVLFPGTQKHHKLTSL